MKYFVLCTCQLFHQWISGKSSHSKVGHTDGGKCIRPCRQQEARPHHAFQMYCSASAHGFTKATHNPGAASGQPYNPLRKYLTLCFWTPRPLGPVPSLSLCFFSHVLGVHELLSLSPTHILCSVSDLNALMLWGVLKTRHPKLGTLTSSPSHPAIEAHKLFPLHTVNLLPS